MKNSTLFPHILINTAVAGFTNMLLVGPLTEFLVMPWVRAGGMNALVGDWWGTTDDRAMAVVFVVAGLLGIIMTLIAFQTRSYRNLSESYMK